MLTHEERVALAGREIDATAQRLTRLLEDIERYYVEEWTKAQLDTDPEYVFEIERRLAEIIDAQAVQ